ncbi:MICOS complex subunit mic10 like protein [Verticillium longisporum]|nr:MICOS complex subunit mic10 like protein [Verticillium longisporum]
MSECGNREVRDPNHTTNCPIVSHVSAIMSDTAIRPPPSAVARPVSEALLNEKWDRCLSNLLVKSSLGLGFGVVFSVLLFKRRAWPAFVGAGFGAGRAYEECNFNLRQAARDLKKQA